LSRVLLALLASAAFATGALGQMAPGSTDPLPRSIRAMAANDPYVYITGKQRAGWFVQSTVGIPSLAAGVLSAGWATAWKSPKEYPRTWEGFGKRYGMRLSGVSTGNAMEASLGAIWGEDPRYFRAQPGTPFWGRVTHVMKTTFVARHKNGGSMPAIARTTATAGNNFLSNTWRVESHSTTSAALLRTGWGILGRMATHGFAEFWPDVRRHIFQRNRNRPAATSPPGTPNN